MRRVRVVWAAVSVLSGCGTLAPRLSEPIPPNRVPPGFTAEQCRWVNPYAPHDPLPYSGAVKGVDALKEIDAAHRKVDTRVTCQRTVKVPTEVSGQPAL